MSAGYQLSNSTSSSATSGPINVGAKTTIINSARSSDIPGFLKARLEGTTSAAPGMVISPMMLMALALGGVVLAYVIKRG